MPWPISLYQGAFSLPMSMPAAFQRSSSAMGARAVAARDEGRALGLDDLQSLGDVGHAFDAARIALRPDQDEIVVHHGVSFAAETVGDEFLLLRLGVHEHHVGVAASASVERLAGALRHHLH